MAVKIVSLTARLGLDGSGFQQGLSKAGGAMNRFAGNLKAQLAGAFGTAALTMAVKNIMDAVGRIKDLSEQFGVTTDEVQKLDAAAKMSGQSFDSVGVALERLGKARQDAAEGNEELRGIFSRFGVALADLNNPALRNIDLMGRMAAKIREMNLSARDAQALRELFGRSGARLAAVFADMEGVKVEIISESDIEVIDKATRKLEELENRLLSLGASLVNLRGRDFLAAIFTPGFFRAIGVDPYHTPGVDSGPISKEEVEKANAAKRARMEANKTPLFEEKSKQKEADKLRNDILKEQEKIMERLLKLQMKSRNVSQERANLDQRIKDAFANAEKLSKEGDTKGAQAELARATEAIEALDSLPKPEPHDFNLTDLQRRGLSAGVSFERAFQLKNPDDHYAQKIAAHTNKAQELLREINAKMPRNAGAGGGLIF